MEDLRMKKRFVVFGRNASILTLLVGVSIVLASCDGSKKKETASTPSKQATAAIGSASGSEVTGTAVFKQSGDTIVLTVDIQNAVTGVHAVHIHESGDCSSPDGKSAGGHWNPTDVPHGKWGEGEFHLGDIGNMTVGEDGTGKIELTTDQWEMGTGSIRDIVGKGIIVHAGVDDFTSQPSGAAGARIGCGAIVLAEPK
jgi:Cu-Zn family superoxide dismutase